MIFLIVCHEHIVLEQCRLSDQFHLHITKIGPKLSTWHNQSRAVCHLLILIEEVVGVLVEHHAANRLQGEDVLRPGLGVIQRVKVKLVLVSHLHGLDHQLPLWIVPSCNGVIQVLQHAQVAVGMLDCK